MDQIFRNKIFLFLTKHSIIALLVFAVTFLQIYWAMGSLSERMSSGCLDCSFLDDAYFISLFTTVILTIILFLISLIKKRSLRIVIQFISLVSVWFFWNYSIFADRESSWSTYRFKEELLATLYFSLLPILVLSVLTVIFLNYISKMYEFK